MTADDYLRKYTGKPAEFWLYVIGQEVHNHTNPTTRASDVNAWLRGIHLMLWHTIKDMPCYNWAVQDENIVIASLLGLILSLWACRITRAKAHDPRRPLDARHRMMEKLLELQHVLFDAVVNENFDHHYFPAQEWTSPFTQGAFNGEETQTEAVADEDKSNPRAQAGSSSDAVPAKQPRVRLSEEKFEEAWDDNSYICGSE